jgi:Pentapeptide repeats (8 copies)
VSSVSAVLERTNLTGANLTGADLTGADLTGADLRGARWPVGVAVPDGWTADSGSGRLKTRGTVTEIMPQYL